MLKDKFEEDCIIVPQKWVEGIKKLHPEKALVLSVLLGFIVDLCSKSPEGKVSISHWQFPGFNIFNRNETKIYTNHLLMKKFILMSNRQKEDLMWIKPNIENIQKLAEV